MTARPTMAMYCAAGCGGCDVSLLDIHENLLEVIAAADIVFWPAVTDFKYADLEAMADRSIDICFVNGAIRNTENIDVIIRLRAKSKVLIAYGACASFGGVPGLANLFSAREMMERVCTTESTDMTETRPSASSTHTNGHKAGLPAITGTVHSILDLVGVDYTIPGCPPAANQVWTICQAVLSDRLPTSPAVLGAGTRAVCDECSLDRRGTRVSRFVRPHEIVATAGRCLLEQGIVCSGPATRSGCGAQCTRALMPCRGCYGPAGDTVDAGAAMIAALGTLVDSEDADVTREVIAQVVDPVGTFYSYTLPTSILGHARDADPDGDVRS